MDGNHSQSKIMNMHMHPVVDAGNLWGVELCVQVCPAPSVCNLVCNSITL